VVCVWRSRVESQPRRHSRRRYHARHDANDRSDAVERVVAVDMDRPPIHELPALIEYLKATPEARAALAMPDRVERLLAEFAMKEWCRPSPPGEPLLGDGLDIFVAVRRALDLAQWRRFGALPVRNEPVPDADDIAQRARALFAPGVSARVDDKTLRRAIQRHLATAAWPFDVLLP
jgi:hypothetical protein